MYRNVFISFVKNFPLTIYCNGVIIYKIRFLRRYRDADKVLCDMKQQSYATKQDSARLLCSEPCEGSFFELIFRKKNRSNRLK